MEERRTLAVSCLATVLAMVMFTMPMSTLVELARTLDAGVTERTWMLAAASVGLGAGLLISGALADRLGRRVVFAIGAGAQALFLVLGATWADPIVFIVGRVGQGLGAAALIATSLGLIAQVTPPGHRRTRATGIWGASLGCGILVGPVLTALVGPWRVPYLIVGALSLALIVFARALPANPARSFTGRIDYLAAVCLVAGPSLLLAGLTLGRSGWTQPAVLILLAAGVIVLVVFTVHERRTASPLVDIRLFTNPHFVTVTAAAFAAGFGVIALTSYTPVLVDQGMHGSALAGAVPLVVWAGISVVTAVLARHLRRWISPDGQLAIGLIIIGAGLAALGPLYDGDTLLRLLPGFAVAGVGTGMLNAALGGQAVATVPAHHASMGSGTNNTARYLGSGLGVAVVTSTVDPTALLSSWETPVIIGSAVSAVIGIAIPVYLRSARQAQTVS
ncbi:MFS transporter [Kutzneria sp. NPDC052558]|uniref:MFS transporter n=1 Tax=Kutzneria sp. NPDC052558 TaxID=3364121 RepID=UPI0037C99908